MSVKKDSKRKTYYCQFRYIDWTGKSRSTTRRGFATRREALEYEHNFKAKASTQKEITLAELIAEKKAHDSARLKESTCSRRDDIYDRFIVPKLGEMSISKVTPDTIRRWQNELPQHLSPSTIMAINNAFCSLLNFGVRYFGMERNPFNVTGKTGRFEHRKAFLEPEQFDRLIATVKRPHHHLMFRLLYFGGLRIGEALALTLKDIDFERNTISISKTMTRKHKTTAPKSYNSVRIVTLPEDLMQEIKAYITAQYDAPLRLFHTAYTTFNSALSWYLKKAGLPHVCPHSLRHSHATLLIQNSIPVVSIAKRLGHSPKETLSSYAHVYANNDADIANLLTGYIKKDAGGQA